MLKFLSGNIYTVKNEKKETQQKRQRKERTRNCAFVAKFLPIVVEVQDILFYDLSFLSSMARKKCAKSKQFVSKWNCTMSFY